MELPHNVGSMPRISRVSWVKKWKWAYLGVVSHVCFPDNLPHAWHAWFSFLQAQMVLAMPPFLV